MPLPLSAKFAMARINGNILYNVVWNVTPESDLLDTSNKEGGGFKDYVPGLAGAKIHFEGWWDAHNNMYDAPLNIFNGAYLTNVLLYTTTLSSPYWNFPLVVVGPAPMMADVKDLVKYTFDANAKGVFYYPTGSI